MLRISIHDESEGSIQLALEGWLVGPWVDELRQQSDRALSDAKTLDAGLREALVRGPFRHHAFT